MGKANTTEAPVQQLEQTSWWEDIQFWNQRRQKGRPSGQEFNLKDLDHAEDDERYDPEKVDTIVRQLTGTNHMVRIAVIDMRQAMRDLIAGEFEEVDGIKAIEGSIPTKLLGVQKAFAMEPGRTVVLVPEVLPMKLGASLARQRDILREIVNRIFANAITVEVEGIEGEDDEPLTPLMIERLVADNSFGLKVSNGRGARNEDRRNCIFFSTDEDAAESAMKAGIDVGVYKK